MKSRHLSWIRGDLRFAALLVPITLVALTALGWEQADFSKRQIGITLSDSEEGLRVSSLRVDGPADQAGLRSEDLVRSVHGVPIESLIDYDAAIAEHAIAENGIDQRTLFVVERDGTLTDVGIDPGVPFPLFSFATTVFTVFAYLIIGPLALRKRPGYLRSNLLFLLTTAIALEIALPGIHSAIDLWAAGTLFLAGLQMALELHLASVIPERQSWLDRVPGAIPTYYVIGVGSATVVALSLVLQHFGWQWLIPWSPDVLYENLLDIGLPLWAGAVLFLLGRQALTYPERQGRQQATLVALGVLPWAVVLLASEYGLLDRWIAFRWQDLAWNLALLPYPLAVLAILYQETTNQEQILLDLTRQVHETPSIADVSRLVCRGLQRAFHPKGIQVFYRHRDSRGLTLGHSSGPHVGEEVVPQDSSLLRLLAAWGKTANYPEDIVGLSPADRDWLDSLGARLVVPLVGRDKGLLGLLILGEKKSEEDYTAHDRNLLRALTAQIALVYENARIENRVSESQQIHLETRSFLANTHPGLARVCLQCGTCFDAETEVCTHDGTELQPALPIERRIGGRYRLDRRLSKGGMGAVYLASDLHLGRPVAIKVLPGNFASQEVASRFETEAQLTARVRHPNVITLNDYGTTRTGAAFLVLELLDGETLAHRLATRGPLTPTEAAPRFDEVCLGVAAAHLQKVVHRDLKPANIFLAQGAKGDTSVRILDFGVARALDGALSAEEDATPGSLIGTFRYMAPEQLRGEDADERSDLFAIGVVLVESLTGALPFSGNGPPKLLRGIEDGYRYPGDSRVEVEFNRVLQRCLHPSPDQRYPTAEALRTDLIPALHHLSEGLTTTES